MTEIKGTLAIYEKRITVRIGEYEYQQIKQLTEQTGGKLSNVVRALLIRSLNEVTDENGYHKRIT